VKSEPTDIMSVNLSLQTTELLLGDIAENIVDAAAIGTNVTGAWSVRLSVCHTRAPC